MTASDEATYIEITPIDIFPDEIMRIYDGSGSFSDRYMKNAENY